MQNKQTAVSWIIGELTNLGYIIAPSFGHSIIDLKIEQAKQMEKEQIVEAFYEGVDQESDTHGAMNLDMKDAENYYNETFKTK